MAGYDGDPLSHIELLASVPKPERMALAKQCQWRDYAAKQTVFDKQSENTDVMFVVSGRLNVTGYSLAGKEISFAEIGEGDFFGEVSAVDGESRSASVTAISDCRLASLTAPLFRALLERHPKVAATVMRRMSGIIRRSTERLMDFKTLNAHQRVCAEVLRIAVPSAAVAGHWEIYPMPTQAVIASRVGASRETVARVLGDLARGGLIARKGRTLTILERDTLDRLTERLEDDA